MRARLAAFRSKVGQVCGPVFAPWPGAALWFALIALLGAIAPLLQIWATGRLIDSLALQLGAGEALPLPDALLPFLPPLAMLAGAWILSFTIANNIFQPYFAAVHAERIVGYWQPRLLRKASRLRLEQFERPAYYDLLQRARVALSWETIAKQHSQFQRMLARAAGCLGIVWAFAQVHWSLALLLAAGSWMLTRWRIRRGRESIDLRRQQTPQQRRQDYWRGLLTQRQAAAEVRLFGLAGTIVERWRELSARRLAEQGALMRRNFRRELPVSLAHTLLYGAVGCGLLLAARAGAIGAGTLVALLFALQQYFELMQNFTRVDRLTRVLAELGYVGEFLALPGDEATGGREVPPLDAAPIRFQGVSFCYPGSNPAVLEEIDLEIRPGERIAIVGENGAGKSTLIRLLLGLYTPTAGCISVAGVDLRAIDLDRWRRQLGAVFQESPRYALTVAENIGLGAVEKIPDGAAVGAAARASGLSATIEQLPEGYATMLGKEFEGGVELSGGQ